MLVDDGCDFLELFINFDFDFDFDFLFVLMKSICVYVYCAKILFQKFEI